MSLKRPPRHRLLGHGRYLLLGALLLLAGRPAGRSPWFSGRIVYENEYQDLAGEMLYYAVKPKNWFYIQDNNFKMYDRNQKLTELYIGATNELYRFEKEKAELVADTARPPATAWLKCLPTTATILGYPCQMLQLVRGGVSTLVFYSAELRVNTTDFSRCPVPGWYALLQATDGALPLRTISVDAQHGYTATSEAIAVQAMQLPAGDFTTTAPAR